MARKGRHDIVFFHQVHIEIAAGTAGGLAQPHRIDVIGALFKRLHGMAARIERGAQADADHGLAGRFVCGRDQHPVAHGCRLIRFRAPGKSMMSDFCRNFARHEIQHMDANGSNHKSDTKTA